MGAEDAAQGGADRRMPRCPGLVAQLCAGSRWRRAGVAARCGCAWRPGKRDRRRPPAARRAAPPSRRRGTTGRSPPSRRRRPAASPARAPAAHTAWPWPARSCPPCRPRRPAPAAAGRGRQFPETRRGCWALGRPPRCHLPSSRPPDKPTCSGCLPRPPLSRLSPSSRVLPSSGRFSPRRKPSYGPRRDCERMPYVAPELGNLLRGYRPAAWISRP